MNQLLLNHVYKCLKDITPFIGSKYADSIEYVSSQCLKQSYTVDNPIFSFLQMRDALFSIGSILEEDEEHGIYVLLQRAHLSSPQGCVLGFQLDGNSLDILIVAKEGLIKQGIAKKALSRVEKNFEPYGLTPVEPNTPNS